VTARDRALAALARSAEAHRRAAEADAELEAALTALSSRPRPPAPPSPYGALDDAYWAARREAAG
jgi:hypothetical protein